MAYTTKKIPTVSVQQMINLDKLMIEKFGISLAVMMEHAGKALAELVDRQKIKTKKVLVFAGSGHNGGGGLVSVRYLKAKGYKVEVILSSQNLKPMTKKQLAKLKRFDIKVNHAENVSDNKILQTLKGNSMVVDAMLGYNTKGDPYGQVSRLIELISKSKKSVIALDIPSGLNPDSGKHAEPTIKAKATLTLALPKKGLVKHQAKQYVGQLYLADIKVPDQWYAKQGIKNSLFVKDFIIRV